MNLPYLRCSTKTSFACKGTHIATGLEIGNPFGLQSCSCIFLVAMIGVITVITSILKFVFWHLLAAGFIWCLCSILICHGWPGDSHGQWTHWFFIAMLSKSTGETSQSNRTIWIPVMHDPNIKVHLLKSYLTPTYHNRLISPPATGHRPPATGHRPSATGHRPSATGHRPSATGHRPSAIGYRPAMPPANGHRPPASPCHRPAMPPATGHRPSAIGYRPAMPPANGHRPPASPCHRPAMPPATGHRPPAIGYRPCHRPTASHAAGHWPPAASYATGQPCHRPPAIGYWPAMPPATGQPCHRPPATGHWPPSATGQPCHRPTYIDVYHGVAHGNVIRNEEAEFR